MLVVVKDINQLDQDNNQIASLGYLPMGEFGIPGRRYFRKGEDNRTHQIHAFQYDNMYWIYYYNNKRIKMKLDGLSPVDYLLKMTA